MTTEEILANAKKLRDTIGPLSRSKQVVWFGDKLGIDQAKLLRLLGYAPKTITKRLASGVSLEELAEAKPEQTVWVSELFRELANQYGYDLKHLQKQLRTPVGDPAGGRTKPAPSKSGGGRPRHRPPAGAVLGAIRAGGPGVLDAFAGYLRPAAT